MVVVLINQREAITGMVVERPCQFEAGKTGPDDDDLFLFVVHFISVFGEKMRSSGVYNPETAHRLCISLPASGYPTHRATKK